VITTKAYEQVYAINKSFLKSKGVGTMIISTRTRPKDVNPKVIS